MSWMIFVVSPFVLGIVAGFAGIVLPKRWIAWICAIAVGESFLLAVLFDCWNLNATVFTWLLGVVMPWTGVAAIVAYVPLRNRCVLLAISVPGIYFTLLAVGLAIGDALGLIPQ